LKEEIDGKREIVKSRFEKKKTGGTLKSWKGSPVIYFF
jgi:hypothetical protein